ncbi:hypothetical protein ACQJBY_027893 [Aegilops geniculata]
MQREEQEEEEFHEADILWPDAAPDPELAQTGYSDDDGDEGHDEYSGEYRRPARPAKSPNRQKPSSPIDIPGKTGKATGAKALAQQAGFSKFGASLAGAGAGSVMIGSQVFVPPHVIVDRRAKRDTAMLMLLDAPKVGRVRAMVMLD